MLKIGEQQNADKAQHEIEEWLADNVTAVVAYIDSVWMFARYLPKGFRTAIEASGNSLRVEPCKDRNGNRVGYRLTVHQPTMTTLAQLDRLHHASLFRFDLAVDFLTLRTTDAEWLKQWLATHLLQRWRRQGPMHDEDNTVYWVEQSYRKRRSQRDMLVYSDRASKISGGP
jgi:hypothetical protein